MKSRTALNNALALGGVIVILLQTLWIADTRPQVAIILAGIMLNQTGVWGLAAKLLPDRRQYLKLRAEVDCFIGLVRTLNAHAVDGQTDDVQSTASAMHESINRMVNVAGVTTEPGEET
jgi:hypothetical protein